jgi:hypothetical protein
MSWVTTELEAPDDVGRDDAVLPAQTGEGTGVQADSPAGILVRSVDAGDTFKGLLADAIHPAPSKAALAQGVGDVDAKTSFLDKGDSGGRGAQVKTRGPGGTMSTEKYRHNMLLIMELE